MSDVPAGPEHDKEVFALWRLMSGAVLSLPESPARERAKQTIDDTIGCRFNHPRLPGCPTRPEMPGYVWPAVAAGGAAVGAALLALIARLIGRLRIRMAARKT